MPQRMEQTSGELELPEKKVLTVGSTRFDGNLVSYLAICRSQFASGVMQQAGQEGKVFGPVSLTKRPGSS
jgi:hypothetical protein